MSDTRFLLLAPNVAAAKAWCADRRVHDSHVTVVTPANVATVLRGISVGLDLVVIGRDSDTMRDLHIQVMKLIVDGLL